MSKLEMILPKKPVFTPNADISELKLLKPCPFCGSDEVYQHDIAIYDAYGEGNVLCPSCNAQVYFMIPRTADLIDRYDVLKRIVAMWNRRAQNA